MSSSLAALRRFARRPAPAGDAASRCDLCAERIGDRHEHLVEPAAARLLCACSACAPRFPQNSDGTRAGTLLRVPPRAGRVGDAPGEAAWRALGVPVAVAFFRRGDAGEVTAVFPGPAGATESPIDAATWGSMADGWPVPAPHVEAILVSRLAGAAHTYLVSIDVCYRLVGVLRARWVGFAGGEEAWAAVQGFFAELPGA